MRRRQIGYLLCCSHYFPYFWNPIHFDDLMRVSTTLSFNRYALALILYDCVEWSMNAVAQNSENENSINGLTQFDERRICSLRSAVNGREGVLFFICRRCCVVLYHIQDYLNMIDVKLIFVSPQFSIWRQRIVCTSNGRYASPFLRFIFFSFIPWMAHSIER